MVIPHLSHRRKKKTNSLWGAAGHVLEGGCCLEGLGPKAPELPADPRSGGLGRLLI